ncbi:MAG: hypothetical protein JRD93_18225 [Deltaproteobacteria bacterium]|nr:hypothetical protein [Deltaproteobacteria bacterium]MBW2663856.1 hypothetical protein [Deltaproteobacteria bacterium]
MLAQKNNVVHKNRYIRMKRSMLLGPYFDSNEQFSCNVAQTHDELKQAFSLVYKEYLRAGYVKKAVPSKMLVNIYNLLPETVVWIVKSNHTVVSTLTEIFDSPLGLPIDEVYEKELDELRSEERRIVEISALAIHKKHRWQNAYMPLFRGMLQHALSRRATDLCVAVNPKHKSFYKNILLFEDIGGKKNYPKVSAPSVALRLDLTTAEKKLEQIYGRMKPESNLHEYFFQKNAIEDSPVEEFFQKKKEMDSNVIQYFFVKKNKILQELPPHQIEYFQSCYSDYDFSQIPNNKYASSMAG